MNVIVRKTYNDRVRADDRPDLPESTYECLDGESSVTSATTSSGPAS